MDRGYSFDYVSDAQLGQSRADQREIAAPGGRYKVLVVPATRRMPVATLQVISRLAAAGATVIFEKLPEDVPGYGRLEARRAEFKQALSKLGSRVTVNSDGISAVAPHARREGFTDG